MAGGKNDESHHVLFSISTGMNTMHKILAFSPTRRKLFGNVIWLYGLQGLNYLAVLATLPYLVRVLGIEEFGLIAFAQAFAQYFVIFTDYGFNLSATKRIARLQGDHPRISRLFWAVILIKMMLMLLGAVILVLLLALVPRFQQNAAIYLLAYLAVVGNVLLPVWLFQGMEQMRYNSIVSGSARILSTVLIFVFVHHRSDYLIALGLQSGGALLAGISGFSSALLGFKIAFCKIEWADIRESLDDGWHLFVSNAATTLYTNTNVFLVGILAGYTQAGYFSAAEKLVRGMIAALGPLTQAIYPHISVLVDTSRDLAIGFLRKALLSIGSLFFVLSVILLIFARQIALLVFADRAAGSLPTLRCIALLPFVIAISTVLAIHTMIPFGLERQLGRIYIVAGLVSLACSVPTIHFFGSFGAGVCLMGVEVLVIALMWLSLRRNDIYLFKFRASESAYAVEATPGING